jgi:hypothetical protein
MSGRSGARAGVSSAKTEARAGTTRRAAAARGARATGGSTGSAPGRAGTTGRQRPAASTPVPPLDAPSPRTPFVLLVLAVVGAGLVGLLLLNTAINENAFRLHDLRKAQEAQSLREQQLQRDLAQLEAPGTLLAAARRLGLVPAGTPAYIRLPSGQVIGVPTPARAEPAPTQKPAGTTPNAGGTPNPGRTPTQKATVTRPGTTANRPRTGGSTAKPGTRATPGRGTPAPGTSTGGGQPPGAPPARGGGAPDGRTTEGGAG